MSNLNLTTLLLGLGLAMLILFLVRRDHLHLRHGLFWIAVAVAAALLGIWPVIIDLLANKAGVTYSPSFLLLCTTIMLIVKSLLTDIANTRIERQVKRLNQRIALFEHQQQGAEQPGVGRD